MGEELTNLIKAWILAIISVCYCYYVISRIKCVLFRLFSVLPVCALFFLLPLFSSYAYFTFILSCSFSWNANFKLILFAFNKGPLFPIHTNLTKFVCFTCMLVYPQENPNSRVYFLKYVFTAKVFIFGIVLRVYNFKQYHSKFLLLGLYPLHLYLLLEVPLTLLIVFLAITLGVEIDPIFDEPYLATSLQDFWGRRWNRPASSLLRASVFIPVRQLCQHLMNIECARIISVFATFLVSGLIHEMIFFHVTREVPTWEVTCFFVLHGVCTVVESIVMRNAFMGWWKVRPVVSRMLTLGFVLLTASWYFFPQF